jgi:hypothetical protein
MAFGQRMYTQGIETGLLLYNREGYGFMALSPHLSQTITGAGKKTGIA